jgi:phosphohistidine phosphatase
MELLVIRHAIAEEREVWARTGRDDDERPLTREGRRKMREATRGLRELVHQLDRLASSPLTRAWQTAEIVGPAFGNRAIERVDALRPESAPEDLLAWLAEHDDGERIAVVGHEPHLSGIVTWMLTGRAGHVVELKKGAACLLRFEGTPRRGGATLIWSLAPGQLRRLAR